MSIAIDSNQRMNGSLARRCKNENEASALNTGRTGSPDVGNSGSAAERPVQRTDAYPVKYRCLSISNHRLEIAGDASLAFATLWIQAYRESRPNVA
jgi:hypothetical protein